ncbi:calcium-activated chloride channel-domain-containing protein [Chytridium lagenaria]|nr:calcium-activated chloride channel-domain-containing protein [Chytridium lagenaria]
MPFFNNNDTTPSLALRPSRLPSPSPQNLTSPTVNPAQAKPPGQRSDEEEAAALELEAFGTDPVNKLSLDDEDERIITRKYQRTLVHFLYEEDVELFDEVVAFKEKHPSSTFEKAMELFVERHHSDAIVKAAYMDSLTHWDSALKYDLSPHSPNPQKSTTPQRRKRKLNVKRRSQSACVSVERGLDSEAVEKGKEDSGAHFIKILAPFEVLCSEAQRIKLMMEVSSRELQIREKVHKKLEQKALQSSHHLSRLQRRILAKTKTKTSSTPTTAFPPDASTEAVKYKPLSTKPFVEGPDGTILGAVRYAFSQVPHSVAADLDLFRVELLHIFKGGDSQEAGNSPVKVKLYFFKNVQRNLLVHEIAQRTRIRGSNGHGIYGINDLILSQAYVDFYPIHDGPYEYEPLDDTVPLPSNPRSYLYTNWATVRFSLTQMMGVQPFREIRDYFGEKVAYYFSFLGFYTLWLWFPAILAFDNALTVPFAFFMAVWVTAMLEFWKRQEVTLRTVWGLILRKSPVTEKIEPHFPTSTQILVKLVTTVILMGAIALMLFFEALVIGVSALNIDRFLGIGLSSLLTLTNIVLVTPLYLKLAYVLTQWENHKTFQRFEDALISKKFIFVFINNFSALLFTGTIKVLIPDSVPNIRHCSLDDPSKSCMSELMFSMAIIFVGLQFVTQFQLVLVPMITGIFARKHQEAVRIKMVEVAGPKKIEEKSEPSTVTVEPTTPIRRHLPQHLDDDLLDNWSDSPNSTLRSFNSIRFGAYRLLAQSQRPFPLRVKGVGAWFNVALAMSRVGILVNACVVAFSRARLAFVLIFEHLVFLVVYLIDRLTPDNSSTMSSQSSNTGKGCSSYPSGTNSQGNHFCARGEGSASGGSYHYSNSNGSYYYQNSNGSTYYKSAGGEATYTRPSDNPRNGGR